MKLLVMSDLHVEFAPFQPGPRAVEEADVVVLAGDIHNAFKASEWIAAAFPAKGVVYVAGNHEFYGGHWNESLSILRGEAQRHGVHFLENDEIVLERVRFLGCTLWTDFCYFGPGERQVQSMEAYRRGLNDCWRISAGAGHDGVAHVAHCLTPDDVLSRHMASRAWLTKRLAAEWPGKTVVVTHHVPTSRSVAKMYRNDRFTPGFASNLPDEMLGATDLWIHGHTHHSCDYEIAQRERSVRILCNPRGYPRRSGTENPAFNAGLLVEV